MKLGAALVLGSVMALSACGGDGIDWEDPQNPMCQTGHYEPDYDNKKVKDGTKTETYRSNGKTKTRTVTKYKTIKVYDGQDWVCDVRKSA